MNTAKPWIIVLSIMATSIAHASAQTLKEQLVGTWILTSNFEEYQDGRRENPFGPNLKGQVTFDSTGRFSVLLIPSDRAKAGGNSRNPVGPAVGHFGTYSVDEADKSLTHHIESSLFPNFEGASRKYSITSIGADVLRLRGTSIPSPQGAFVPVQEWKRVK